MKANFQYLLYSVFSILLLPIILLYIAFRYLKNKEPRNYRIVERLGFATKRRPKNSQYKKIIWFHAASVGEVNLIWQLVDYYSSNPKYCILVTTGTITSARIIEKKLKNNVIHQFVPVDSYLFVINFLLYWKPDLALWTESDFWPNLLRQTQKQCKMILLSARISDKSYVKWKNNDDFIKLILSSFSEILAGTNLDYERLLSLGGRNIHNAGHLKFSAPAYSRNLAIEEKISSQIVNRFVVMLASSHSDEELQFASIYRKLQETIPSLLFIVAPRHPHRSADIISSIQKKHPLNIAIRSNSDLISSETNIYLADTMGEYGVFYRISNLVFMGGSLVPHGGQNLLEPAKLKNCIIFGPYMHNFRDITEEFLQNNAAIRVDNIDELLLKIKHLYLNQQEIEVFKESAQNLVASKGKIFDIYIKKISAYL